VIAYVMNCKKPNGAFGPMDQEYTDAAWNFPAVMIREMLEVPLTEFETQAILANGLGYPSGHAGASHWLMFHQSMLHIMLTADTKGLPKEIELEFTPKTDSFSYYGHPLGRDRDLLFDLNAEEFFQQ